MWGSDRMSYECGSVRPRSDRTGFGHWSRATLIQEVSLRIQILALWHPSLSHLARIMVRSRLPDKGWGKVDAPNYEKNHVGKWLMWRIPKKLAGPEWKLYSREERKIMHLGIVWWEGQWTQIGIWGALKTQSEQVELSGCPSTDREQRKFLLLSIVRGIVKSEVGWNPFLYEPRKYS